jgi:hypothetical protein
MRLESFPAFLGVLFAIVGVILLMDAWLPENFVISSERRRRPRRERDRTGEALVGLGVLTMAGTFLAGDEWRYSVIAVIAGMVLLLWGTKRSSGYLRSVFTRHEPRKPEFIVGSRKIR